MDTTRIDDPGDGVDLAAEGELIGAAENMLRVLDNVATHAPDDGYEFGGFGEHKAMSRLRRAIREASEAGS